MPRTEIKIKCSVSPQQVDTTISSILLSKGYTKVRENDEEVWKKGKGMLEAMQYIKYGFLSENEISLSGWIRTVGGGDMELKGFVGSLPKNKVLAVMKEIQQRI